MATAIHVARRLDQQCIAKFCRCRIPFARFLPSQSRFVSEKIDHHKADVVAGARVFGTRVAQASDQANRFFVHNREFENAEYRQSTARAARTSDLLLLLFFFWSRSATLAACSRSA